MRKKKSGSNRNKWLIIGGLGVIVLAGWAILIYNIVIKQAAEAKPEDLIAEYMDHIASKEYEAMYAMLDPQIVSGLDKDGFIERNSNIYEGIEADALKIENVEAAKAEKGIVNVTYTQSLETIAGSISFENSAAFVKTDEGYKLQWSDSLIFPNLESTDTVKISTDQAERGRILDRLGYELAAKGTASEVGIVPGKLKNREEALQKIAELLEIDTETIENRLAASWVQDDSFVPIKTISKVSELNSMQEDEEELKARELQEQLLSIAGVMISDTQVRTYNLGEAAAHLIGYVQGITAEELEEHAGEGYNSNSVIGKSGIESLYETELKGQDGYRIYIANELDEEKEDLAEVSKQDGEDIQLTIDADLQKLLYEQFKEDQSCSVAMDPYTGAVLALISTPTYDNNDFIRGMNTTQWNALNEAESQPLYNRFRQVWVPGSSFKPITGAIGLETGTIDPNEDFGNAGLKWQQDESWGSYYVTTLHETDPATLENALIYSDNIYFAKAALKIGKDNLKQSLDQLGFNQDIPFEIIMADSQYSNSEEIETEIQLADSGYGQGEIMVNPLHLASLYTAFLNEGSVIKPYLRQEEEKQTEIWIDQAFSKDNSDLVLEGLKKVVNDPSGTGYAARMDDVTLAGKTGTAEIKASQEDTSGTELGWFAVFTTDSDITNPILIISMVEDVKDRGGSGYVVQKDKAVLDSITFSR
ncbi:MAG: penicillin-binding transpeptidase domain-containing protein [Lachnospiraceae bacterium]